MILDILTMLTIAILVSVNYSTSEKTMSTDGSLCSTLGIGCSYAKSSTGYWVCAIFSTIIIYLNLMIRSLDDPFWGPENYNFQCYVESRLLDFSLVQSLLHGSPIDFGCLTVGTGKRLRRFIHDYTFVPSQASHGHHLPM